MDAKYVIKNVISKLLVNLICEIDNQARWEVIFKPSVPSIHFIQFIQFMIYLYTINTQQDHSQIWEVLGENIARPNINFYGKVATFKIYT